MHARFQLARTVRRFNRKHGLRMFIGLMVFLSAVVVGFLMYYLTSPSYVRSRF